MPNKNKPMKSLYIFMVFIFSFCFYNNAIAQQVVKSIKQPPKINGVLKATNSAAARVKIHANSNTVVGTSKSHPNYSKKQKKQAEAKEEKEIKAAVSTKKEKQRK